MTTRIDMTVNAASAPVIAAHLRRCDDDFIPRLSDRVEIDAYSRKIAARATRFEGWAFGALVGLVAAYFDPDGRDPFITSVSVDPEQRERGLASRLLDACVAYARERGYKGVRLEVDRGNEPAIALYQRGGFTVADVTERMMSMRRDVETTGAQR